jgi:hypothetical protein
MKGDQLRMKMLMLTLSSWFVTASLLRYSRPCIYSYIVVYTLLMCVYTAISTTPRPAPICAACRMFLTSVTSWWKYAFGAWTGMEYRFLPVQYFRVSKSRPASECGMSSSTSYSKACLTRHCLKTGKRPIGILRRHTQGPRDCAVREYGQHLV